MQTRHANELDVDAVIPLWLDLCHMHARFEPTYRVVPDAEVEAKRHFHRCINEHERLLAVAVVGDRVSGYIAASLRKHPPVFEPQRIAVVTELAVASNCRRSGVGRALYRHAVQWVADQRASRIEVRTLINNEQSNGFWKAMGFDRYAVELRAGIS